MSRTEAPDLDNPDVLRAQITAAERTQNRAFATALAGSLLFAALDTVMKVPAVAQAVPEGPVTRAVAILLPALMIAGGMSVAEVIQRPRIAELRGRLAGVLSISQKSATLQGRVIPPQG